MISLIVNIKEPVAALEGKILGILRVRLNSALSMSAPAIKKRLQNVCEGMIQATPEYKSLMSDELLADLGIPSIDLRLKQILDTIKASIEVKSSPVTIQGNKLAGGMRIGILRQGFEDILGLSASSYVSHNTYLIPWLQWLIIEGDRIVILDYEVFPALTPSQRARSRTGMALMRPGSGFRVDPEFSGTVDDNFLTRAFDGQAIEKYVTSIVKEEIQRRL